MNITFYICQRPVSGEAKNRSQNQHASSISKLGALKNIFISHPITAWEQYLPEAEGRYQSWAELGRDMKIPVRYSSSNTLPANSLKTWEKHNKKQMTGKSLGVWPTHVPKGRIPRNVVLIFHNPVLQCSCLHIVLFICKLIFLQGAAGWALYPLQTSMKNRLNETVFMLSSAEQEICFGKHMKIPSIKTCFLFCCTKLRTLVLK